MKILYYSDTTRNNVFGTKRSLFREVKERGHEIRFVDKKKVGSCVSTARHHRADQVWLAHSTLKMPPSVKQKLDIPVVGFGFSDPYFWKDTRLDSYDAYVTNYPEWVEKCSKRMPTHLLYTACDQRFHKHLKIPKAIPISVIGVGRHKQFTDPNERIKIVRQLRKYGLVVMAFGADWPKEDCNYPHISGDRFLSVIAASHIGIDIQDEHSPPAHRMMEYGACGTPVITRRRPSIEGLFEEDKEILLYSSPAELTRKVRHYLKRPYKLAAMGEAAMRRCQKEHDIKHRVDALLPFVEGL